MPNNLPVKQDPVELISQIRQMLSTDTLERLRYDSNKFGFFKKYIRLPGNQEIVFEELIKGHEAIAKTTEIILTIVLYWQNFSTDTENTKNTIREMAQVLRGNVDNSGVLVDFIENIAEGKNKDWMRICDNLKANEKKIQELQNEFTEIIKSINEKNTLDKQQNEKLKLLSNQLQRTKEEFNNHKKAEEKLGGQLLELEKQLQEKLQEKDSRDTNQDNFIGEIQNQLQTATEEINNHKKAEEKLGGQLLELEKQLQEKLQEKDSRDTNQDNFIGEIQNQLQTATESMIKHIKAEEKLGGQLLELEKQLQEKLQKKDSRDTNQDNCIGEIQNQLQAAKKEAEEHFKQIVALEVQFNQYKIEEETKLNDHVLSLNKKENDIIELRGEISKLKKNFSFIKCTNYFLITGVSVCTAFIAYILLYR